MDTEIRKDLPEDAIFDTPEYRRSRIAYRIESAFEYFVAIFVRDAFLTTVLQYIGLSTALIGIVANFVTLAFTLQIASVFVAHRVRNTKRFVTVIHTMGQLLFSALYLIPFLPGAKEYKTVLVIVCIMAAYFGNYFVTSILYKWCNSFVDPHKRGSFSAGREVISLISGLLVTLGGAAVMDAFTESGNQEGGFIFAAVGILIFSLSDLVCLLLIAREHGEARRESEKKREDVSFRTVLRDVFKNRNFRDVLIMAALWSFSLHITSGFLAPYALGGLKEGTYGLGLSLLTVQLITNAGAFCRAAAQYPFGRYSDKTSYARGLKVGQIVATVAFVFVIFTSPTTWYFYIPYMLFYTASVAGTNQNMNSIIYSCIDSKYFVEASAIKNTVTGLAGFASTFIGAWIVTEIERAGFRFLGIGVYPQQVLAAITVVLCIGTVLFNHFVVSRQRDLKQ